MLRIHHSTLQYCYPVQLFCILVLLFVLQLYELCSILTGQFVFVFFFFAARWYLLILHPMNKIPNLLNGVTRAMSIWTFSLYSLFGVRKQLPWYSFFWVLPKWPIRENWTCNASVVCQNTLIMELCHATQLIVLFHCSKCSETFVLIHAASAINAFIKISCICHLNEMMLLY